MPPKVKKQCLGKKFSPGWSKNFLKIAAFVLCTALSFMTRFYQLSQPDHVCWDETHFGKMGSYYINRTFFFDVHPPLGKMLIGAAGYFTGYDGSFPFEAPGDKYGDVNYMGMRIMCATLGALVVPLVYLIVIEWSSSWTAAFIAAMLIIFDTGSLTLSQYILLDPILMFFITISVFALVKFQSHHSSPFRFLWWFWMTMTGLFLACAFSVKWVGLFVILFAGIYTAWDLWVILGDLTLSHRTLLQHLLARCLCLILLPVVVYLGFFTIHLQLLNKSGSGDGFFSSAFQSRLVGNNLHNVSMPEKIAYGSIITLKNHRPAGGLLHSHPHLYPEGIGVQQQQVTAYPYKDENNQWLVKKYEEWGNIVRGDSNDPVMFVKNGDLVILEHLPTGRNLHSHDQRAPVTASHQQVTCYGENGTGDANDIWRVEVPGAPIGATVSVVKTRLKLVHYLSGCSLFSHSKTLPSWAWEQLEVTCNPFSRNGRNLWNVEDHYNPKLQNVTFDVFSSSFLDSLVESHIVMAQGNSGLKPRDGEVTSQPWQWPFNYRGQRFTGYNDTEVRIYLLGNPVIFWGNLSLLASFLPVGIIWLIRRERGLEESGPIAERNHHAFTTCSWLFLGWCLHYFPFYLMRRVLYFHHYFPAFIFSCMLSGVFLDHILYLMDFFLLPHKNNFFSNSGVVIITAVVLQSYPNDPSPLEHIHGRPIKPEQVLCGIWLMDFFLLPHKNNFFSNSGVVIITAVVLQSFYRFHPLSYGMAGPLAGEANSTLSGLKWLDSWEI